MDSRDQVLNFPIPEKSQDGQRRHLKNFYHFPYFRIFNDPEMNIRAMTINDLLINVMHHVTAAGPGSPNNKYLIFPVRKYSLD
jgi:hypothetical protein